MKECANQDSRYIWEKSRPNGKWHPGAADYREIFRDPCDKKMKGNLKKKRHSGIIEES